MTLKWGRGQRTGGLSEQYTKSVLVNSDFVWMFVEPLFVVPSPILHTFFSLGMSPAHVVVKFTLWGLTYLYYKPRTME
ncbi:hypothetical protein HOY80DRAFT_642633 [Tuber brumale]|nr:hypothetical protein HOY80DRAFT_642633 [Tuber brumale]